MDTDTIHKLLKTIKMLDKLKKRVDLNTKKINSRMADIERKQDLLTKWEYLKKSVTQNVQQTDESVLNDMIKYFGNGCLKDIIREKADGYIQRLQDQVLNDSLELETDLNKINP